MYSYTESGITHKMYNCMEGNADFAARKTMSIYTSLEEYMKENLNLADLNLSNFRTIFIVYILINLFWVVLFLISECIKALKALKNMIVFQIC